MPAFDGVRVLQLGQIYNGPYCGLLFAQLGADVIKVEQHLDAALEHLVAARPRRRLRRPQGRLDRAAWCAAAGLTARSPAAAGEAAATEKAPSPQRPGIAGPSAWLAERSGPERAAPTELGRG